jgi:hypothetical protein
LSNYFGQFGQHSSGHTLNPNGGVMCRRGLKEPTQLRPGITLMKRSVRTRMQGVVRRVGDPPYPIMSRAYDSILKIILFPILNVKPFNSSEFAFVMGY